MDKKLAEHKTYTYKCAACEYIWDSKSMNKCPQCGKGTIFNLTNLGMIPKGFKIKMVTKNKNGFVTQKVTHRYKKSKGSGKRAVEKFIIDRKDPLFTRKLHKVEEWDGINWTTEHDEEKNSKAKRRPK